MFALKSYGGKKVGNYNAPKVYEHMHTYIYSHISIYKKDSQVAQW